MKYLPINYTLTYTSKYQKSPQILRSHSKNDFKKSVSKYAVPLHVYQYENKTCVQWNVLVPILLSMSDFPEVNKFSSQAHTIGSSTRHFALRPMSSRFSGSMSNMRTGDKKTSFSCVISAETAWAINITKVGVWCVRTEGWNLIEAWMCGWVWF